MTEAQHFEAFMKNYQNMVYGTALRLVANGAEAEDISQEVFLKAFERFDQLRDNPRAAGWLKTVATNLSLNHLSRYRSRWSFFSELFANREDDEDSGPEFEDPRVANVLEQRERSVCVEDALRRLPHGQRVPLVLYHIEGLSYEEIASKLGVSLGKVKTDIFRGRTTLKKKLQLIPGLEEQLS
ncbi:MAG TPA: RNA polymerase sigma factor [Candidatus Paceibacterota bacterium]|nr:RNA polymerase sigma factor [Candidatus Paceibacterota bacterium]